MPELVDQDTSVEVKYVTTRVGRLSCVITAGKALQTNKFVSKGVESTVTNYALQSADEQVFARVAVFADDADKFKEQITAGEAIAINQKWQDKITHDDNGREIITAVPQPSLSYDRPLGTVEEMFS